MFRPLSPAARSVVRRALDPSAWPFAEAVVAQAAHPLGGEAESEREEAVVEALLRLFRAAAAGDVHGQAATLAEDPVLLAALFQNADLLHLADDPHADAVSVAILGAVHRMDPTF